MCPNLVQHDRVVENFKLNFLVLNKMRFHSEIENCQHWKFSLFYFKQISKLKSVSRFGRKSISKYYLINTSKKLAIFIVFVTFFLAIKLRTSIPTPDMWASTNVILIYKTYKNIKQCRVRYELIVIPLWPIKRNFLPKVSKVIKSFSCKQNGFIYS